MDAGQIPRREQVRRTDALAPIVEGAQFGGIGDFEEAWFHFVVSFFFRFMAASRS